MKTLVLDVKNLSVRREGKNLLDGISFQLHTLEILSVIGARGAGKGLLRKTLLGIQEGQKAESISGR